MPQQWAYFYLSQAASDNSFVMVIQIEWVNFVLVASGGMKRQVFFVFWAMKYSATSNGSKSFFELCRCFGKDGFLLVNFCLVATG